MARQPTTPSGMNEFAKTNPFHEAAIKCANQRFYQTKPNNPLKYWGFTFGKATESQILVGFGASESEEADDLSLAGRNRDLRSNRKNKPTRKNKPIRHNGEQMAKPTQS